MEGKPVAIIDIGSNSIRLVVYAGATRIPWIIFNEKVMVGLGRTLSKNNMLSEETQERALDTLRRYRLLIRQMNVVRTRVVATAAVRDAANGAEFLRKVRAVGLRAEMLSGEQEGRLAGLGVLSAIPDADGIAADLGGGSLELVEISGGEALRSATLPFGVLRLGSLLDKGEGALAKKLGKAVEAAGFDRLKRKRPLYLVGGSWRALARLDMLLTDYPLPIIHQYVMAPNRPADLQGPIRELGNNELRDVASLSLSRMPTLPGANLVLKHLVPLLKPGELIVSSFGIREGLLFHDLDAEARTEDPLIEAARDVGRGQGRFTEHGALLDDWIGEILDDEPWAARLRLTACMLSDVAWQSHPDFRAERGVDLALHGNWVGVDHPGRVMIAQALFSNFGGGRHFDEYDAASLCTPEELERASVWGLAMRLGQRLSGGVAASLERSRLSIRSGVLRLTLGRGHEDLYGEVVERRLRILAQALGCKPEAVAA
jgi:exopolyphosphatase/guanosine-5'-triphosphate,3'-diphosphate pyrophosphatase